VQLYDYPEYYEVAFSFRDIPRETAFLDECISRFSTIPVDRILEVACGTAPHAIELVKRGYSYCGLDVNRYMLDHARYKLRDIAKQAQLVLGDMVDFEIKGKVDFAYVMLGSLYLSSSRETDSHFDSVARALNPGGLYLLDWCVQFGDPLAHAGDNAYSIEQNGIRVDSKFNIELIDADRRMYEEIWTVAVNDHGRQQTFEMTERNKAIMPQEFLNFIENRDDFAFVGWWQDWQLTKPITTFDHCDRPVALVRHVGDLT